MTVKEAKEILRRRYARRGYAVTQVRRVGDQFNVCFGRGEGGRGSGPDGLESILCNWPVRDVGAQQELELVPRKRKRA
jgi:hypothetical protein